jgi:nickel superoxide dismutase
MNACIILFITVLFSFYNIPLASSHCELPCGIYGDGTRITMLEEDIATVEKSMAMITELSKEGDKNYNQLVRWVNNKEKHADLIQECVSQYFMTQRIKPADESKPAEHKKYLNELSLLHEMLIYAMKAKQTTDPVNVDKLRSLLQAFKTSYLGTAVVK